MSDEVEMTFYVDFVNVDKTEHTLFNTNEIDFLYDKTEQPVIQTLEPNIINEIILHFSKPVKELVIVFLDNDESSNDGIYNFQRIENIEIRLNNIKLHTTENESYFRMLQPYYHNRRTTPNTNIYMYSFAIDPDNTQATGSYNFGNLRSKVLSIHGVTKRIQINVYATANNVLKIREGEGVVQFI